MVSAITQSGENHSYTYDNVGNITSVTRDGKTRTYVYDNLGQLTRVNDPADTKAGSTGTTWVYDYDRGGNILSKKYYAYTTGTLGSVKGTEAFTYGASNWGDKLVTYKGTTVTYTGANIKKVDGWTYSYGYNNLLTQATKGTAGTAGYEKVTFSYDALGRLYERVHTVYNEDDGKNHVEFFSCFWNGDKLVHITRYTKVGSESYTKTDALHFYYDADGKPSHVQLNDTRFFYQYNLQGDVIGILAGGHSQVVRYEYDAWGKIISITGDRKDNLGKYNPFRYRHYMYDDSVSLYYLKSRHYHPTLCRFLQADSTLGRIGGIGSHNPFSYCKNSPIVNIDPTGHEDIYYTVEFRLSPKRKWGTAEAHEKAPRWFLIDAVHQSVAEKWKYNRTMAYGQADCIGIARITAQSFYKNESAFNKNIAAKASRIFDENLSEYHVIDPDNLDAIPAGAVLFSKNASHMGYYLGYFNGEPYCMAETTGYKDVMHYTTLTQRLYNSKRKSGFYYWGLLNYIDYSTPDSAFTVIE